MNHIAHASKQYQLEDCLVQGLVQTLDKQEDKWHIKLEDDKLSLQIASLLQIGRANIPFMPDILKRQTECKSYLRERT